LRTLRAPGYSDRGYSRPTTELTIPPVVRLRLVFKLITSWLKPDRFHTLVNERAARWYNACLRITNDAGLAEDAVQDALLRAWDRRDEFRGDADLDTWIHRIALNAAIDLVRRRKPQLQIQVHEDVIANLAMAPPAPSPESHYAHEALGKDLALAMQRLTPMERQTFLLKHIEGWRLEEIADSQHTNVNNAKQTLFRAVRKLRADLHAWRGQA
jgi:RNA polymerase sigma-70 factor, ECF subfamily